MSREGGGAEGGADLIVEPAHLTSYKHFAQWNFLTIMKGIWTEKQYKSINFYGQFDNNLTWQ